MSKSRPWWKGLGLKWINLCTTNELTRPKKQTLNFELSKLNRRSNSNPTFEKRSLWFSTSSSRNHDDMLYKLDLGRIFPSRFIFYYRWRRITVFIWSTSPTINKSVQNSSINKSLLKINSCWCTVDHAAFSLRVKKWWRAFNFRDCFYISKRLQFTVFFKAF